MVHTRKTKRLGVSQHQPKLRDERHRRTSTDAKRPDPLAERRTHRLLVQRCFEPAYGLLALAALCLYLAQQDDIVRFIENDQVRACLADSIEHSASKLTVGLDIGTDLRTLAYQRVRRGYRPSPAGVNAVAGPNPTRSSAPPPGAFSAFTNPPPASAVWRTIARPKPEPGSPRAACAR